MKIAVIGACGIDKKHRSRESIEMPLHGKKSKHTTRQGSRPANYWDVMVLFCIRDDDDEKLPKTFEKYDAF